MPKRELDKKGIDELLSKVKLCHLGTVDSEGNPYIVPLGYRYVNGAIYIHVADKGEKIDNIRRNPNVCIEVTSLDPTSSMLRSEDWGDFASVIIRGKAEKVVDEAEKVKVYGEAGWGVVYKIKPEKITGRAWFRKSS
jgi:hypothetical protein